MEQASAERVEIVRELTRGPNGATAEEIMTTTGWPFEIVRPALAALGGGRGERDFKN